MDGEADFLYNQLQDKIADSVKVSERTDIKLNELVSVRGVIVIPDGQKPESIPSKPNLMKLDGCFCDGSGSIVLTVWNEHIELLKSENLYEIQNIRVRRYNGVNKVHETATSHVTC